MRHHTRADEVKIECDEDGFHLIVETEGGDYFNFSIHDVAEGFYWEARKTIGSWLSEREIARRSRPTTREDLEAYPLGDPKRITLERELQQRGSIG